MSKDFESGGQGTSKATFWMFGVIVVVLAVLLVLTISNTMTGNSIFSSIFSFFGASKTVSAGNGTNGTCYDSDGLNYFTKGYCQQDNSTILKWDYCDNSTNSTTCFEQYCNTQRRCASQRMDCRNLSQSTGICYNGACVQRQSNITNCTDSDGGINIWIKGIVGYNGSSYTDFCWKNGTNVTNATTLAEFYCWDDYPSRTLIYCPGGCNNGACLNTTVVDISPGAQLDDIDPNKKSCQSGGWYHHTYATEEDCVNDCYYAAFSYCSSLSIDCWPKWQNCNGRFCNSACEYFGGGRANRL